MRKTFRKIVLFCISFILAAVYFLLTFIVIMFVSSSLHIINRNLFRFKDFDIISGIVTAGIFIFSAILFFKSFRKTYRYLDNVILKDIPS